MVSCQQSKEGFKKGGGEGDNVLEGVITSIKSTDGSSKWKTENLQLDLETWRAM